MQTLVTRKRLKLLAHLPLTGMLRSISDRQGQHADCSQTGAQCTCASQGDQLRARIPDCQLRLSPRVSSQPVAATYH